jgi:hypothetical protein
MKALYLAAHLIAQLRIEIAQGLVEQEQFGIANDRPPNSDPLTLPTRQMPWKPVKQRFNAKHGGGTAYTLIDFGGRGFARP